MFSHNLYYIIHKHFFLTTIDQSSTTNITMYICMNGIRMSCGLQNVIECSISYGKAYQCIFMSNIFYRNLFHPKGTIKPLYSLSMLVVQPSF